MFFAPVNKNTGEERNQLQFWYTQPDQFGKAQRFYIEEGRYANDALAAGMCKTIQGNVRLSSRISRYYMRALLNGPHEDGSATAFCFAYSFKPIELTYDYGDGKCDISVSTQRICI